ncbi:L-2,4-diaminobutyrate decarboxylase [Thermoflexales bacterium]|nr:L-2,4-diaminobutyrate decarboxylase [Thermoflexales bacterium]
MERVILEVAERLHDNYPYFHPLYAGQMLNPPHPVARLASMLAMWINPNNHALDGGRASSRMEKDAVGEIATMFGWETYLGHLTSGGTMANLEALRVADCLNPTSRIVASEQAHYTHSRISAVLKVEFEAIPCDQHGRLDVEVLKRRLDQVRIGTVVATIGTTAIGSIDYLPELLKLREQYAFRIHADAGDETGERLSTANIAARLSEMHVPTWADTRRGVPKTRGTGKWCVNSVRSILCSPTYIGTWQYGKGREDAIDVAIPPIIDLQTWQAAQWQRLENTIDAKRNTQREYLMRCRLTCSCGYSVSAHRLTTRGNVYLYYRCSSWLHDYAKGGCKKNGYFSVPDLDRLIWDWLKDWFKDPAGLRHKFESYQAERARINAPLLELLRVNDSLIADHESQLKRAKDMYQFGVINADELLERKVRLEATIVKLEAERDKLQGRLGRELSLQQITEVIKFAEKLTRGLEKADQSFEARRRIIELLDVRAIIATEDGERWFMPRSC